MSVVGYNSYDAMQTKFLSALALGESGNASNAYSVGYGGVDLSSAELGSHGFPQWSGNASANTHAAGAFQFQPGTWADIAGKYNLDFDNPSDQNAGAWYLAQQAYTSKTGRSLADALAAGDYSSIQSALGNIWPSVNGNAAAPQGLAANLANGVGATLAGTDAASGGAAPSSPFGIVANVENWFQRFGLIVVGGIIIIAALWALLSNAGYSFKDVANKIAPVRPVPKAVKVKP